jgi:hypothetical protein
VAIVAILLYGRMLVHEWASFFRVAFIAKVVDGTGLQHFVVEFTVRVMTVNACNFALPDRMMGLFVYHGLYVLVALITDFGFFRLQELVSSSVWRVAIIT